MSFRYRLAPKHTFPTQFHDCYAVVKNVLTTADKYGIDSNRVVVAGDSAGGNLATAIALKLRDENLRLAAQVRKKVLNLVPKVLSHLSQSLSPLPPPPPLSLSLLLFWHKERMKETTSEGIAGKRAEHERAIER